LVELNRRSALAGVAAFGAAPKAFAQASPGEPIKIVVPFAAGSATDLAARGLGAKLQEILKQPIIVSPIGLDDFAAYVKTETAWWTKSVKAAGIEPE
jgi:tripartite-type tricarboxylate transporter receptor subunit TctC